jgi:hypothetical protein
VPLQKPSDSVIQHFCGPIKSYENFIHLVQQAVKMLDKDWSVVIKRHPLEDQTHVVEKAIYSNANIKDLIELSDAILLINSGVGVLSMLWNRPVYYCGEVFYADDRINRQISNVHELINNIESGFKPSKTIIYRFLYFLLNEFYSFGRFTTKEAPWSGGGRMTITTAIDFYRISNIEKTQLNYYVDDAARIGQDSIVFDRYAYQVKPSKNMLGFINRQVFKNKN